MKQLTWKIFGVSLVIAVLAAGVYTAVRLLTGQTLFKTDNPMNKYVGRDGREINFSIVKAPELPDRPPDAGGVFLRYENDNPIIGTGETSILADPQAFQEGILSVHVEHSGPELEVVITPNTIIYQDVTDMSFLEDNPSGEYTIQQMLIEVKTINKLGEYDHVSVWGEIKGDRIIAVVFVFIPSF